MNITDCEHCGGRGWYAAPRSDSEQDMSDFFEGDYVERFCDCEAGDMQRERDGVPRKKAKP